MPAGLRGGQIGGLQVNCGLATLRDLELLLVRIHGHLEVVTGVRNAPLDTAIVEVILYRRDQLHLLSVLGKTHTALFLVLHSVHFEHLEVAHLALSVIRETEKQRWIVVRQESSELNDLTGGLGLILGCLGLLAAVGGNFATVVEIIWRH